MPLESRNYRIISRLLKPYVSHIAPRSLTIPLSRGRAYGTIIPNNDPEEFYRYSAQKWLWNEPVQLLCRYVQFNIDALIHVAEEAAGHGSVCVDVSKLPEGNSNKVFVVTMQDGKQLIVKFPNPNSGPVHYTTASEVATMQFVREKLHIPVPKVLGYCSRPSESKLGVEYIIMEKAPGIELGRIWENLKSRDKFSIVKQIAAITCTLARAQFPYHGALYRRQDVTRSESFVLDDEFAIGPTTGRAWFDNRRAEVEVPRGPWTSAEIAMKALVQREIASREIPILPPRHSARHIWRSRWLPSNQGSETICSTRFPQNMSSSSPQRREALYRCALAQRPSHAQHIRRQRKPISDYEHYRLARHTYLSHVPDLPSSLLD